MAQKRRQPLKQHSVKKVKAKVGLLSVLLFLAFGLVSARAGKLHLSQDPKLKQLASRQYKKEIQLTPKRGNIFDNKGDTLALDIKVDSIFAHPHLIEDKEKFLKDLQSRIQIDGSKIRKRLNSGKKFVWIKRRISPEESLRLKDFDHKAFGSIKENKRFYPNGVLASNLLGAVGFDSKALSGIELAYDQYLKTIHPPIIVAKDAKGRSYTSHTLIENEHPKNVKLTIDKTIQYIVEKELEEVHKSTHAKGAVALVLEVHTGQILAMASSPTFDPNQYWKYPILNWKNKNITDTYEPGSIFKIFTAAAAMDLKGMKKTSHMNCENGAYKVGKHVIHDHGSYGNVSLETIVKKSSNICSYKIAQQVGKKKFYDYIKKFGFGEKTDFNLPGESKGIMASFKNTSDVQIGTIAFGQGISVTPLQIVSAYGAVANGGQLMRPYIVSEITDHKGKVIESIGPKKIRQVFDPKLSKDLLDLLVGVVEPGGTGTLAAVDGYLVGGKTGTAQKVIEGRAGYSKDKYIASFVGIAPIDDPKIVVLVSVDEPRGNHYGGGVSGPVFSKITQKTLAYLGVPPKFQVAKQKKTAQDKSEKISQKSESEEVAEGGGIEENQENQDSPIKRVEKEDQNSLVRVPDFKGLSVREASRLAQDRHFRMKTEGSGVTVNQNPAPGDYVERGSEITLTFQPI